MKASRRELMVEGAVELPHVIAYLEKLVEGLRSGAVEVSRGEERVVLGPRGVLGLSLSAVEKKKRQRLRLELSWRKLDAPSAECELTIGAAPPKEPAPTPASLYAGSVSKLVSAYVSGAAEESAEAEAEPVKDEPAKDEPEQAS